MNVRRARCGWLGVWLGMLGAAVFAPEALASDWADSVDAADHALSDAELPPGPSLHAKVSVRVGGTHQYELKPGVGSRSTYVVVTQQITSLTDPKFRAGTSVTVFESAAHALFRWRVTPPVRPSAEDYGDATKAFHAHGGADVPKRHGGTEVVGRFWVGCSSSRASFQDKLCSRLLDKLRRRPGGPGPTTTLAPPPPPTTPAAPTPQGKPPCEAAQRAYGVPATPTGMAFDLTDLRRQFGAALDRWQAKSKRPAYARDHELGTLPAIGWLANQGGLTDDLNKRFVLTTDAQRTQIEDGKYRDDAVPKGTERRLYLEIAVEAERVGRRLSPGEVFYLALEQRDGDAKEALLLAHNTLRTLARVSANPIHGKGDLDYTMIQHQPGFFAQHLQPLIASPPLGEAQNTGAWYHLFGVAYFEMQARGEQAGATLDLTHAFGSGTLRELNLALDALVETEGDDRTAMSRLANEVEQKVRKHLFRSPDDPLKYCYNIWGARLGGWLHGERVRIIPVQRVHAPAPVPRGEPLWGSGLLARTVRAGKALGAWAGRKVRVQAWKIRTLVSGSPVNITWRGGGHTMVLDQRSQNLYGRYPVHLLPFYEPATRTWGAVWVDASDAPTDLSFEAVADGVHHLTMSDGAGGAPEVHAVEVRAGERFRVVVGPDGASAVRRVEDAVARDLAMLERVVDASGGLEEAQISAVRDAVAALTAVSDVPLAVVFAPPLDSDAAAKACGVWRARLVEAGVLPSDSALLLYAGAGRGYSRAASVDPWLPMPAIKSAWQTSATAPDLPSRVRAQLDALRRQLNTQ